MVCQCWCGWNMSFVDVTVNRLASQGRIYIRGVLVYIIIIFDVYPYYKSLCFLYHSADYFNEPARSKFYFVPKHSQCNISGQHLLWQPKQEMQKRCWVSCPMAKVNNSRYHIHTQHI